MANKSINWNQSLISFLSQLKQLKKISLYGGHEDFQFDTAQILRIIGDYGKNLERVRLNAWLGDAENFKKEVESRVASGFEIWEKQGKWVMIEKILD